MGVQPEAYFEASRIVFGRNIEVHGCLPVGGGVLETLETSP